MKIILIAAFFLSAANLTLAQYKPVDEASSVKFKLKNFGFNTGGFFKGLKGTIGFDPNNLATASFDVTLKASSVNTDNESRDEHLKAETYFDVNNYPLIHFVSTNITGGGKGGSYLVTANLTIKRVTKQISFPFTATPSADGYVFNGDFKINRREFAVGGSSTLSDNVEVSLSVVARKN